MVQFNHLGVDFNCPTALPSNYKPAESGMRCHHCLPGWYCLPG